MIGPSFGSKGGIASVVSAYQKAGLFDKWPIIYLCTHVEGTKLKKLLAVTIALCKFISLILRGRVGLVHVHVPRRTAFWRKSIFILFSYLVRKPVLMHMHSGGFPEFYHNECGPTRRWLVRFVLDRADKIIVLSSQWQKLLEDITENRRLIIVPNFIVLPDSADGVFDRPSSGGTDSNYIFYLGRLTEEKGFFDLLEALALVKRRFSDVKLLCGGEIVDDGVVSCIKHHDLSKNVELLGWVDGRQKWSLIRRAMIFVFPSRAEGMPMSVIEAMSQGVPVVATRVGGVPEVISTGVDGLLVEVGDVKSIADAIEYLISQESIRLELGARARDSVLGKFTAGAALPKLENLYQEYGFVS